ncbi:hypothetical protein [Prochlorococcus marinus]|uniref:hypothetical protein n=1 Tax=Prochlorococcus marinus TaxID=1219 RepID=UPI0022B4A698|nr:hypothetical protein [Prochlorococcus marinus]
MSSRSPVAIFIAASTLIAANTLSTNIAHCGENEMGGLKEWTTDQAIDEDSKLDDQAKKARKKAKEEDICIPIGEGENCW